MDVRASVKNFGNPWTADCVTNGTRLIRSKCSFMNHPVAEFTRFWRLDFCIRALQCNTLSETRVAKS
jgi:hypothetical protein